MITINIKNDFSSSPGFRYYHNGEKSGEEFYDRLLKDKFQEAVDNDTYLKVILDGTAPLSSFLDQSFSMLGKEFGNSEVWSRLIIISNDCPKYIKKIKEYLNQ